MSRADISAGKAHVELYVKNSKFVKGLNSASKQLTSLGKDIAKIGVTFQAAGAAVLAPLGAAVAKFAEFGDSIHKMSIRTGAGAEFLSEMGFAAEQSGASIEQLGNALFRMRRRVANAATEAGPAQRALSDLGLAAEELTRLKPEEQFTVIADRLSGVANESLRAQYAFEIFGDGAKSLLPLLSEGSAGMAALRKEARDLGLTMSDEDANAAAEFGDAMNRLKTSMKGIVMTIGRELAPVLTGLQDRVTKFVVQLGKWIRDNSHIIRIVAATGAALFAFGSVITAVGIPLITLGTMLSGLATVLVTVAKTVGFVGGAFMLLLNPVGLVVTAVGLATAAWLTFSKDGQAALGVFMDAAKRALAFVSRIATGITQALTDGRIELAASIAATGLEVAFFEAFDTIKAGFWTMIKEMAVGLIGFKKVAPSARSIEMIAGRQLTASETPSTPRGDRMARLEALLEQAGAPAAERQQVRQQMEAAEAQSQRPPTRMTDINAAVMAEHQAERQRRMAMMQGMGPVGGGAASPEMQEMLRVQQQQLAEQRKMLTELRLGRAVFE